MEDCAGRSSQPPGSNEAFLKEQLGYGWMGPVKVLTLSDRPCRTIYQHQEGY